MINVEEYEYRNINDVWFPVQGCPDLAMMIQTRNLG